jgi:phosphatidylserine/phosphatidylglycerophosphate/cardiolipin synthase-like enzyme
LESVRVLITAEEAYPEMERAFLTARRRILACYRVFDPLTRLRSREGREVGHDWFDLILHVLRKGVEIDLVISDFDPILAPALHCETWRAKRALIAAAELAGPDARLRVTAAPHAARVGLLPRLVFWIPVLRRLGRRVEELNRLPAPTRARALDCSPGLWRHLRTGPDGSLAVRWVPPPELIPGSHHQKIAVFDDELLCIGGLDLDERRYDDKGHHRRRDETWHDVQVMCRGPVVEDARRHLETFLDVVAGHRAPPAAGRLLTTLSRRRRWPVVSVSPRTVRTTLADAHHRLALRARRLIYVETQFFRSRDLARTLAKAARANPELGMILILPAAPEDVAFERSTSADARLGEYLQARALGILREAFGDRLALLSPVRPAAFDTQGRDTLEGSPIIYVHAKVSIFDDDRAIVASANLNGRSLAWDTEAGVMLDREDEVRHLRARVFRHWLGPDADDGFRDPRTAPAAWAERARQNAACAPDARKGFLVPHDPRPARRFGKPLPFIPDEMV